MGVVTGVKGIASGARILALNGGSSSLKFGLYDLHTGAPEVVLKGEAEGIGGSAQAGVQLRIEDAHGSVLHSSEEHFSDLRSAANRLLDTLAPQLQSVTAIAHRIVHGGPEVRKHQLITPDLRAKLEAAKDFAPLHTPPALAVVDVTTERFPHTLQVACLDTAFHRTLPERACRFALPEDAVAGGVQRYGAHGLSLESAVASLGPKLKPRAVIAHLGGGCSVTAVLDGRSIDTTMGLTPTGGMMMGTRTGDLDPGVLIYLLRHRGFTADALEDLVDRRSGLLGVAGESADLRALQKRAQIGDAKAALALKMFCYQGAQAIAKMAIALADEGERLDQLIFTGGIGEHASEMRARICAPLRMLGVVLEDAENTRHAPRISPKESGVEVLLVPAQEELRMANIALKVCSTKA